MKRIYHAVIEAALQAMNSSTSSDPVTNSVVQAINNAWTTIEESLIQSN